LNVAEQKPQSYIQKYPGDEKPRYSNINQSYDYRAPKPPRGNSNEKENYDPQRPYNCNRYKPSTGERRNSEVEAAA